MGKQANDDGYGMLWQPLRKAVCVADLRLAVLQRRSHAHAGLSRFPIMLRHAELGDEVRTWCAVPALGHTQAWESKCGSGV